MTVYIGYTFLIIGVRSNIPHRLSITTIFVGMLLRVYSQHPPIIEPLITTIAIIIQSILRMRLHMLLEEKRLVKSFPAHITQIRLLAEMRPNMPLQAGIPSELLLAMHAREILLVRMGNHVPLEIARPSKGEATESALMRPLVGVRFEVRSQTGIPAETLLTVLAAEIRLPIMDHLDMAFNVLQIAEMLTAHVALVRLLVLMR